MIWHLSLSPQLVSDDDGHDFTHENIRKKKKKKKKKKGIQSPSAEHAFSIAKHYPSFLS
jgi:hypothetical protein